MSKLILFISGVLTLIMCCKGLGQTMALGSKIHLTEPPIETIEMNCDSIYPQKGYKITLTSFDTTLEDETVPNSLFTLSRFSNGQYLPVFSDSIFSSFREIDFADFDNDGVPDILVQNISDVRSNHTYYLYLVDTVQNKLKKINGFQAIKNPNYLPQYNLITSYVMSGKIRTSFYKIKDAAVKDLGIIIYDNQTDDGAYEKSYRRAVRSILKQERNSCN